MKLIICIVLIAFSVYGNEKYDGPIIGIDLGTSYSCVGVFRHGKVEIIPNDQGSRVTPSYVAFSEDGERLIGDAAKNYMTSNPENTIFNTKRFIGRSLNDTSFQADIALSPFQVLNINNKPYIQVKVKNETKTYAPEEISAMILGKMKTIAEDYLDEEIKHAVVTVPAYFSNAQRQATKDAGTIAGLNVIRLINEPTAAGIAYGLHKKGFHIKALVFDLGGGTFDASLLTIEDGVFNVVATCGNTTLGGEDFDNRVIDHYIQVFKTRTGMNIKRDKRAVQKLRREVERGKRNLAYKYTTTLEVDSLYKAEGFQEPLSRAQFEKLNKDLFNSTLGPVERVLKDAGWKTTDVDEIVLVGGSTRIKKIQEMVKDFFGGKEPSVDINPDEAIAYGAAVQGGILARDSYTKDVLLVDVTPVTLGLENTKGEMVELIARNTVIPTEEYKNITTYKDDQDSVSIVVYEGESRWTKYNNLLGKYGLQGLQPAPKGEPIIKVTYEIDANGILVVTAEEMFTINQIKVVIKNTHNRLSREDVKRMTLQANKDANEDKRFKDKHTVIMDLERFVYSLRHRIHDKTDLAEKLSVDEKIILEQATDETIRWLENNVDAKVDDLIKKKKRLSDLVMPIVNKYPEQHWWNSFFQTKAKDARQSETMKEKAATKRELEDYVYYLKILINKVKDIEDSVTETLKWLDSNDIEMDELKSKKKKLETIFNEVIHNICQSSGIAKPLRKLEKGFRSNDV